MNSLTDLLQSGGAALVLGVGRSGLAAAEVLRGRHINVFAYDDKPAHQLAEERRSLAQLGIELIGPQELDHTAAAVKFAIISPGVPSTNPAVQRIANAGLALFSEIELAFQISKAPIIAVTGSKGKSTTTALIGHILRTAGKGVRVGGNIGNPLVRETAVAGADDWVVAEVSSFQLEGIRAFAPRVSVLLNISPDHLDRYASMKEYAEAKYRIFANQTPEDTFVGNADDPYCADLNHHAGQSLHAKALWFGLDPNDTRLTATLASDHLALRINSHLEPLLPVAALRLRGMHNVQNALAAGLASLSAGANLEALREGLASFEPLPHRLTVVRQDRGITWIDDSKATNPDAAVKALEAFNAPIILIAGGKSKKTDFAQFAKAASQRAKLVILIGEAATEIAAHLTGAEVRFAHTLAEAVEMARQSAVAGDVVLLSPGCASFDMFANAEQRGEAFAELARSQGDRTGMAAS